MLFSFIINFYNISYLNKFLRHVSSLPCHHCLMVNPFSSKNIFYSNDFFWCCRQNTFSRQNKYFTNCFLLYLNPFLFRIDDYAKLVLKTHIVSKYISSFSWDVIKLKNHGMVKNMNEEKVIITHQIRIFWNLDINIGLLITQNNSIT